ncbi:MAG TPA: hypothetical protein VGJ95_14580 [Pseudonocardiaceae bacterium]
MSADGQTVVGYPETAGANRYVHAFRWTPASGIQDLGVTNGTESDARGLSANGALVCGEARKGVGYWRASPQPRPPAASWWPWPAAIPR